MKNFITILLGLLFLNVHGQATADWYNFPGGVSIANDAANNTYTANWDYNPAGDITLTKRNSSGLVLWNAGFDNTNINLHELATWVAVDNNNDILVSGTIRSGFSNPVNAASVLMKFNSAGVLLWRVVYESSFDGSSTKKCLVDANNNIYVLGIGTGPNGQVTKVKKFNSAGVSVWNYFDVGIGAPITFKFTPDNKIVIIHRGITGILNAYSKIDLNGNNIWSSSTYSSTSIGDAAGDAFGNTYIVNGTPSELKKLSPTGALLWTQPNAFNGNKVEVGTDNNPVLGGYQSVGYGVVMKKYDANGNLLWQNLDADGPAAVLLAITPMRLDANNAAYIAGSTMSAMGVCKVNSNGVSQWSVTTPTGYPVWFVFGTDDNVYVTGGTTARVLQSAAACAVPSGLSTSNVTTTSARFNWSTVASALSYNLRYRIQGSNTWLTQSVAATVNSLALTGLVSFSNYEWQIQTVCQSASAFSSSLTFSTTCTPPSASISGAVTLCPGASNLLSATTGTGLSYQWLLNGANISGAINANYSATLPGSYSCNVSNSCGSVITNTLVLSTLAAPATPGTITGQKIALCGGLTITYTINPVSSATSYIWTVTTGMTINSGQGTTSISVTYPTSFSTGTISVIASNACGNSASKSSAVKGIPEKPTSISGRTSACRNQTLTYSTALVSGATQYNWTVPTGATVLSGQGSNSVRIKFGSVSGNVKVRTKNNCGTSAYTSLAVVINCRESETVEENISEENNSEVVIYPNPSVSGFSLLVSDFDTPNFNLTLSDLTGRVHESYVQLTSEKEFIFGEQLAPGIYIASFWINEKRVTKKIVKQ